MAPELRLSVLEPHSGLTNQTKFVPMPVASGGTVSFPHPFNAPQQQGFWGEVDLPIAPTSFAGAEVVTSIRPTMSELRLPLQVQRDPSSVTEGKRFVGRVKDLLDAETVESGVTHAAEDLLAEVDRRSPESFRTWIADFFSAERSPNYVVPMLRLLGRTERSSWKSAVARNALSSRNVHVRDAAVQAFENWGSPGDARLLSGHVEEVSWLRRFVEEVAADLNEA